MSDIKYKYLLLNLIYSVLLAFPNTLLSQGKVGDLASDFEYTDTKGDSYRLSDFKGNVVFLAFIGHGCPFCRAVAPSTESDIWQVFKSDSFQALALETWNGSLSQAQSYVISTGITYPLLTRAGNELDNYRITYDNYLVLDHQGIIRYSSADNGILGERYRIKELTDTIKQLLTRTGLNSGEIPVDFNLSQNYPNPFNATTVIKYTLLTGGYVTLIVYDLSGREVDTLVDELQSPTDYVYEWSPQNLPSGIYFYKLQIEDVEITRKMAFIK
ncbi:MAG: redoxin domain-containing protein [Candidatus Marinimicrobia bacterium]|nr:redoxin domain-containing protein [Candidatus Neomarinimicrobiota bacterium]